MKQALGELEKFLHDRTLPPLLHVGLAHAQFETIHPFLDGNGRIGRLLITLLLCQRKVLSQPLLYLSIYLKAHRAKYYDRLTAIRNDGDWEGWLSFFLHGVCEVSESAALTAHEITKLRESIRDTPRSPTAKRLIDSLFLRPWLNVNLAAKLAHCSFATANKALDELVALGLVREVTGQKRNRTFKFEPYLRLFDRAPLSASEQGESVRTQTSKALP
jgi:Fic family protein